MRRHPEKEGDNDRENVKELIDRIRAIIVGICSLVSRGWKWLKDNWQPLSFVLTSLLVICNVIFAYYNYKSNDRFEKLYISQIRPLIEVAPIGVVQDAKLGQVTTIFSILNFSGFDAHKIGIDLKYEGGWISEWRKARSEKESKGDGQGVIDGKFYSTTPAIIIPLLKAEKGTTRAIKGACGLEEVCKKGADGMPVLVRVKWENSSGYVFDEVHKYKLICTKDNEDPDPGSGRSFNFIPEGIISQNNLR